MKIILQLLFLFALVADVDAQIVSVELTGAKAAAKYRSFAIERGGRYFLIGEVKSGIGVSGSGNMTFQQGRNELWMPDPGKPELVPYAVRGEKLVVKRRRQVLGVLGTHIERVDVVLENESLASQAREYDRREAIAENLESLRNHESRKSEAWFGANQRLIHSVRRLHSWLERNGYPKAEKRWGKRLASLQKAQAKAPVAESESEGHAHRVLDMAKIEESIRMVSTPDELTKISDELTGGSLVFRVQESQHVRITYLRDLSDGTAHDLLRLAETIIADFREEFVNPFVDEEFADHIPEGVFQEFWFGPPKDELHGAFMERYYDLSWGPHKEQRIKPKGARRRTFKGAKYLDYWRLRADNDLEGIVAHGLGHSLANLHFNADERGTPQDWIAEGLGTYLSLEHLGENSVTCKRFQVRGYARERGLPGSDVAMHGARAYFTDLALDKGSSISQIAAKNLSDLGEGDLAKAFCLIEFSVQELGREGQLWLREACRSADSRTGFLPSWRAATRKLFPTDAEDSLQALDARWRSYTDETQALSMK